MRGSSELWFATSNAHKFDEAAFALRAFGISLKRLPAKGTEIQSDDLAAIAEASVKETFATIRQPVIAEDAGLFVSSLNGFPGPYASYVERTLGPASLITLLKGAKDRKAEFVSAVAYCSEPTGPKVFIGRLRGRISASARGSNGFGFDPVFVPLGDARTLAEMSLEEKGAISHRSLALRGLGGWLQSRASR